MIAANNDILTQLRKEIIALQGLRAADSPILDDVGLQPMQHAFPDGTFPTGAIHEFISAAAEHQTATCGFVSGLLGGLMRRGGACLWISTARTIYPPALKAFGVSPDHVIFIDLQRENDALWVAEEALRCDRLAAVVCETSKLDFIASRRLQLAVEKSRVTGFILRHSVGNIQPTACVARWYVSPTACVAFDDLPGLTFPRWLVQLQKIRNGTPDHWIVEYTHHGFVVTAPPAAIMPADVRKIV